MTSKEFFIKAEEKIKDRFPETENVVLVWR